MLWCFLAGVLFAGTMSDLWCAVHLKNTCILIFVANCGVLTLYCVVSAIGRLGSRLVWNSVYFIIVAK